MLEAAGLTATVERSARRQPLGQTELGKLLATVHNVVICRGRKTVAARATDVSATDLRGPTGNIRAPLLVIDKTLLVGFQREALTDLIAQG